MKKKQFVFWLILFVTGFVLVEVTASVAMLYRYRLTRGDISIFREEPSYLSSVNLLYKAAVRVGLLEKEPISEQYQYDKNTSPYPFIVDDELLGFSVSPGQYVHTYLRRRMPDGEWESFKTRNTINHDGSRWTGNGASDPLAPKIFVFGDSWVYGSGVNDEQTFSYHLQQAFPETKVILYALAAYSLAQAYLRFETLKDKISPKDIIILAYGDHYDRRHVEDPKRLREIMRWNEERNPKNLDIRRRAPRVLLKDGAIVVDYVETNCRYNKEYCEQPNVEKEVKIRTTVALINAIAQNTPAKVYLLHFRGSKDNPVRHRVDEKVTIISALPEDFDYFILDDAEGFDPHPGPYWHYAVARKLIETMSSKTRL